MLTKDSPATIWHAALGELQLEIPRPNFETWLKDTSALSLEGGTLIVSTPNTFAAEMLEQRLSGIISRAVERAANRPLSVEFSVSGGSTTNGHTPDGGGPAGRDTGPRPIKDGNALRPGLTFETFVVGDSNRLAHAAAANVAEAPGRAYNPLYIYSNVWSWQDPPAPCYRPFTSPEGLADALRQQRAVHE